MKNLLILTLVLSYLVACSVSKSDSDVPGVDTNRNTNSNQNTNSLDSLLTPISAVESAFTNKSQDLSVVVKGAVTSLLSDDTEGDKHQRFIISLSNKQTLLITHNIDIGTRVTGVKVSSVVYVHGDYIWNDQGGLIHWTHHDPMGKHEDGWIVFNGVKYE
jgi:hypothetical protein